MNDDGSASLQVRDEDSGIAVEVASIDPPWSRDATGQPVETHYSVRDGALVQVVTPDADVSYPIVADPRLTFGLGVSVNGLGHEWKTLKAAIVGAGGAIVVGSCLIVNIPNPWAAVLKAACGTIGASNLRNFVSWVRNTYATSSLRNTTCYQIRVPPQPNPRLVAVNTQGNCFS